MECVAGATLALTTMTSVNRKAARQYVSGVDHDPSAADRALAANLARTSSRVAHCDDDDVAMTTLTMMTRCADDRATDSDDDGDLEIVTNDDGDDDGGRDCVIGDDDFYHVTCDENSKHATLVF